MKTLQNIYEIKPGAIIHGDCLTVMRSISDKYVDAIITDPPYGMDFQSRRPKNAAGRFEKIANDKTPFIWWIYDAYRVVKDAGAALVFSRWDVQQAFIDALTDVGFKVKSVIIWDKMTHGMGDLKAGFAPSYETCIFAIKGKYAFPGKRPLDIIQCPKIAPNNLIHPNEKPVDLLKQLIEAVTEPGALILEPFAGSGSTLAAATLTGRKYIGIEINEEYHAIAQTRALSAIKTLILGSEFNG